MRGYRFTFFIVLLADVVSALSARLAYDQNSALYLWISVFSLMLAAYFVIRLMEYRSGILVNISWLALGTINVTLASYFAFGERISLSQGLAMLLIVFGLALMEFFSHSEQVTLEPLVNPNLSPEIEFRLYRARLRSVLVF